MTASQTVKVERQIRADDGSVTTILAAPEKVVPGDKLVYTVNYLNDRDEVTEDFRLDMPIPNQLVYIEGSANVEGAVVLYSIDGGTKFLPRADLVVATQDGGTRAANAADITHIRWTLQQGVGPGEAGQVQFKGQLK